MSTLAWMAEFLTRPDSLSPDGNRPSAGIRNLFCQPSRRVSGLCLYCQLSVQSFMIIAMIMLIVGRSRNISRLLAVFRSGIRQ